MGYNVIRRFVVDGSMGNRKGRREEFFQACLSLVRKRCRVCLVRKHQKNNQNRDIVRNNIRWVTEIRGVMSFRVEESDLIVYKSSLKTVKCQQQC